jgi:RNA polymerase sigma factor (sigma-70 family)
MTVSDYNACVDQHSDGLYRFLLKHIKDTDVARDLVQDTFEKLWRKVNEIEASKAKSYLFTTGYHTLIDHTRRAKKQGDFNEVKEHQLGYEKNYSDLKEILNRALDKLPEIQKTVILLRDYEGYDYTEIGKITDLNESQVKVYIFRARQALKNYIGKMEIIL